MKRIRSKWVQDWHDPIKRRRKTLDDRMTPPNSYGWKVSNIRRRYLNEVNDFSLIPKPLRNIIKGMLLEDPKERFSLFDVVKLFQVKFKKVVDLNKELRP